MIFDNTSSGLTLLEISQALVEGLAHELSAPRASNKLWTTAVKAGLYELGQNPELLVCCHNSKESGEWLLDLIWMRRDTQEIVLAVESEWGRAGDIEDDFVKLVSIKAPRKLMLFATKIQDSRSVVEGLEHLMRKYRYHLEGEEYVALNVTAEKPLCYHFRVPRDGRLDAVSFIPILPVLRWPWPVSPASL
jgi:hypothetical protein